MTVRLSSESKIEMSTANNSQAEILIVDDDALSRKILAQVLTSAGYNCQVCEDGFTLVGDTRDGSGGWTREEKE